MPYRNKTYVAFDGDEDIRYYNLMKAWRRNNGMSFNFYDAHDIKPSREWSSEQTIKRNLRARLNNAKIFVCLIGEHTRYLYKFVRWEIEVAREMDLPLIGCNLNGLRRVDTAKCPPLLRDNLSLHIPFNATILEIALNEWGEQHQEHAKKGESICYYYTPETYHRLGM